MVKLKDFSQRSLQNFLVCGTSSKIMEQNLRRKWNVFSRCLSIAFTIFVHVSECEIFCTNFFKKLYRKIAAVNFKSEQKFYDNGASTVLCRITAELPAILEK